MSLAPPDLRWSNCDNFGDWVKMNATTRKRLPVALFGGASLALSLVFLSDELFSSQAKRTIRIIVPSTVGGGADVLARLLADHMGRKQNIKVVIENRPGASNMIGTEVASRAEPDGNTLLMSTPEFVINAHLHKLNYDPLTSFKPVCYLARSPQLFVVNGLSPYRTLEDLLSAARAKPGELTLVSAGPASSTRFAIETLKRLANVKINYIPYQGSQHAVNAVLTGQVTSALASYPNVVGLVKDNQLHALAVTSPVRVSEIPDVPTVAEFGFDGYESEIWFGIVAPAETPEKVISELEGWFMNAVDAPELKPKFAALGLFATGICGAEFGAFISREYEKYGRAIRQTGLIAK
jgi:tripartite-type tricarboxylate transporter receptor subunit TctC